MTNEQKLGMVRMRLEGATLQEIGDAYKCTRQYVYQELSSIMEYRQYKKSKVVYPRIAKAMKEQRCTNKRLADFVGVTPCSIHSILSGKTRNLGLFTAWKIASALGLKLDEAFCREEDTDVQH